jgi:hypothetical protein
MTQDKDQSIAKILEDCESMIERFDGLSAELSADKISTDIQKETLSDAETALEPQVDAFFDLFVEDDAMSVVAEFRPPRGGQPLGLDQIEKALVSKNVVHGVVWDEVAKLLEECNLERKVHAGVVIARGTLPVSLIPSHLELDEHWTQVRVPEVGDLEDLDFKEVSPLVMVEPGDLLARRIEEQPGVPGTDVLGREVPFPKENPQVWTPGDHVMVNADRYLAGLGGRLVLAPPTFGVSPILELMNGIDYHTGNIHFKGDVELQGRVSAGFIVEAEGNLHSRDTLDAFLVKVGGQLTSEGGIIGNGTGRVEVGGSVMVKFIENAYLLSQGGVQAVTCVLNSIVKTRGKFVLGDKGILAGGQIHALDGVKVQQVGTATGPATEIFVGLDYRGMEKIVWLRDRIKELGGQLKRVDTALPYAGPKIHDLMAAAKKLRVEIVQLTEAARTELVQLGQNEEADVVVQGAVFPGTHIEICHVQFLVTQKMNSVRFYLDKRRGVIGLDPLTPNTTTHSAPDSKKHY